MENENNVQTEEVVIAPVAETAAPAKKNNTKLIIIGVLLSIVVLAVIIVIAIFVKGNNEQEMKDTMEKYSKEYAEKYIITGVVGLDETTITVEDLDAANGSLGESYDLSKLKKCTKKGTKAVIELTEDGEISKVKVELDC